MSQPVYPLVQSADFEQALKAPSTARSPHFAVHHVVARPVKRQPSRPAPQAEELSTVHAPSDGESVDKQAVLTPDALWLGTVVPKRHARRAVTRNLLKRQMREAVRRAGDRLPGGLWVVRLRQGFDRTQFASAASAVLRGVVREELDALLRKAAQRTSPAP